MTNWSRRAFVRAFGLGGAAAAAMPRFVTARGREAVGRGPVAGAAQGAAIIHLNSNENPNGPGVKAAMEELKDFDVGGLTSPITYTASDHRASTTTPIYQVKTGKLTKVAEYKMPRKAEWLGL